MKVAVSASGRDLDSSIDPRFGRCAYFIIVDPEDMSFEVYSNDNAALGGGAGIQSAQFVASKGAKVVITGNCGPNAVRTLNAAGIEVIVGQSGTVSEAIERFRAGQLSPTSAANVPGHYGMGPGMERGRGMGMGGKFRGSTDARHPSKSTEIQGLKQQAEQLRKQIEEIERRIQRIEGEGPQGGGPTDGRVQEGSMRIAVPVSGGKLNPHFGHSESFLIMDVHEGQIKNKEVKTPPPHEPGVLPNWMAEQGVSVVIAGGMGRRALSLFEEKGIHVVTGAGEVDPEKAVKDYLQGTLVTGENVCDH